MIGRLTLGHPMRGQVFPTELAVLGIVQASLAELAFAQTMQCRAFQWGAARFKFGRQFSGNMGIEGDKERTCPRWKPLCCLEQRRGLARTRDGIDDAMP